MRVCNKVLTLGALCGSLALGHAASADLIHHYTFDNGASVGADTGTIGGRNLTEKTRGTGGTVSQIASVTDSNGLTRNGVIRITGESPTTGDNDTTNGSWMEHDAGTSTTLANFTVALWYRTDIADNAGFSSMFSNGPGSSNAFQLDNGDNGVGPDEVRLNPVGGANRRSDTSTFATNTWIHVALTYDGSVAKMYVNGAQVGADINANPGNEFQEIRIASNRGQSRLFDGDFDDLQVHNVALSAQDVAALVPEPSSLAMLCVGGFLIARRRRG